ncbi:unnamed protein product [Prorocentrum cordatum]|uniref:AP2/ERF domain-containing protein n=1 Tax=Prorocentrum cordatum TaxID=2364126 RepID=A0ABN9W659_9DINO|nr:unnamed protein product [Polarella glacialis]
MTSRQRRWSGRGSPPSRRCGGWRRRTGSVGSARAGTVRCARAASSTYCGTKAVQCGAFSIRCRTAQIKVAESGPCSDRRTIRRRRWSRRGSPPSRRCCGWRRRTGSVGSARASTVQCARAASSTYCGTNAVAVWRIQYTIQNGPDQGRRKRPVFRPKDDSPEEVEQARLAAVEALLRLEEEDQLGQARAGSYSPTERQSGVKHIRWDNRKTAWRIKYTIQNGPDQGRRKQPVFHPYDDSPEEVERARLAAVEALLRLEEEDQLGQARAGSYSPTERQSGVKHIRWDNRKTAWRIKYTIQNGPDQGRRKQPVFRPKDESPEEVEQARLAAVEALRRLEDEDQLGQARAGSYSPTERQSGVKHIPGTNAMRCGAFGIRCRAARIKVAESGPCSDRRTSRRRRWSRRGSPQSRRCGGWRTRTSSGRPALVGTVRSARARCGGSRRRTARSSAAARADGARGARAASSTGAPRRRAAQTEAPGSSPRAARRTSRRRRRSGRRSPPPRRCGGSGRWTAPSRRAPRAGPVPAAAAGRCRFSTGCSWSSERRFDAVCGVLKVTCRSPAVGRFFLAEVLLLRADWARNPQQLHAPF